VFGQILMLINYLPEDGLEGGKNIGETPKCDVKK
jgi:hypothetical protein